jgi:hypothetical protein
MPRGLIDTSIVVHLAARLPLYTTKPSDFVGLDRLVKVVAVARPAGL